MTGREILRYGARANVGWAGLLLLGGASCQGEPLYLGPIEIAGSVDLQPEDSGGGTTSQLDAAIDDGGVTDAAADSGLNDAGDAAPAVCVIPVAEPPQQDLPLVIDTHFAPSGWAGDAANGGLIVPPCDRDRELDAAGDCHFFRYTPIAPASPGSASWASVFFQYPVSNWGSQAGLPIAPGARRVSFLAAGAEGGEIVTFRAGGIGDSAAGACADEFDRDITVRLTSEFQRYEIDLSDVRYTRVISPFSWKISKVLFSDQTPEPIGFYLDDLHWE